MEILLSDNVQSFSMSVLGYEFPESSCDGVSKNWLAVRIEVQDAQGFWECTDPSVEAGDLPRLASWLESAASGCPPKEWCYFTEPNLSFAFDGLCGGMVRLRICFEAESRPPWSPQPLFDDGDDSADQEAPDWPEYCIAVKLLPEDVRRAAADVRADAIRVVPLGLV